MNTFYWLVKREFWEHRGGFLWAPVITATAVVVLNLLSLIAGQVIGGRYLSGSDLWDKFASASPEDLRQVGGLLDISAAMPMGIICVTLFFVLFSYCMKNLSHDRSDRSILFWKSLPVSDLATVLSKVFSAVVVAPVIAVIVGSIGYLVMLLVFAANAAVHGIGFGTVMWTLPHHGRMLAAFWGMLPIYMVWMLPSVGWLMMCSAWSSGKVARWAIALPVGLGVMLTWLGAVGGTFGEITGWVWKNGVLRMVFSTLPGSWVGSLRDLPHLTIAHDKSGTRIDSFAGRLVENVGAQYHLLLTSEFLWGALAGVVMIGVAIWFRRWRTEL